MCYILDEALSWEFMVIHVIIKVSFWLGFFSRKNRFLNIPLCRLLCNKIIQPFFDYACNACSLNVNKKLKTHEGLLETERHIQHKIQRFGKTKLASDSSKYIAMFSIQCVSIQCVYFFFTKNCRISMRYLFLYSYNSLLLSIFLIFFFFFFFFFFFHLFFFRNLQLFSFMCYCSWWNMPSYLPTLWDLLSLYWTSKKIALCNFWLAVIALFSGFKGTSDTTSAVLQRILVFSRLIPLNFPSK